MSLRSTGRTASTELRSSPSPALRVAVIEYVGYADSRPAPEAHREHPSALVPLVVDLGAGWRVGSPAAGHRAAHLRAFAAGMHDAFALVEPAGPVLGVQVDLTPTGARRLLGVPMHELRNATVALDDLLGPEAAELAERLAGAAGWPERFSIMGAVLERRLLRAPPVVAEIEWAWRQLDLSRGTVTVQSLAHELGWSRKRLIVRFRDAIGLTPKTAARVLRFQALRARVAAAATRPSWAGLAVDCGYADQSHMIREVRRLTGLKPTQLASSETFVQDRPASATQSGGMNRGGVTG